MVSSLYHRTGLNSNVHSNTAYMSIWYKYVLIFIGLVCLVVIEFGILFFCPPLHPATPMSRYLALIIYHCHPLNSDKLHSKTGIWYQEKGFSPPNLLLQTNSCNHSPLHGRFTNSVPCLTRIVHCFRKCFLEKR